MIVDSFSKTVPLIVLNIVFHVQKAKLLALFGQTSRSEDVIAIVSSVLLIFKLKYAKLNLSDESTVLMIHN